MRSLIVGPAWVGDMVMAGPLIEHLAARGAQVHVVAPAATAPIAQRMAAVDAVHLLAVGHGEAGLGRRYRLARCLRALRFEHAYVLPNTLKSALVPWLAGIPRRTGYRGEHRFGLVNDLRRLDVGALPRLVDRYLALAAVDGRPCATTRRLPTLEVDASNLARLERSLGLPRSSEAAGLENIVCLCPGAEYGPAKRWPAGHFAEVARHCVERGFEIWLLGSATDRDTCAEIARQEPRVVDLSGRTSLLDAIDLLSVARFVVSNDSGLMHVAAALARRVIALFGSSSADFTPPLGPGATVLQTSIECRPCFRRSCPFDHYRCLTELTPERVIAQMSA